MKSIKISKGLAEFYGAMMGDGCLSKYYSNYAKQDIFCILLTGHTHDDKYYEKTIRPIFKKEFGINGCIRYKKKDNVVRFETNSKRIFDFLHNMGFPIGLKGNIKIPKNIFENNDLAICCIRGIFDTDGSIYKRYSKKYKNHAKKYDYKNIQFKMSSKNIIYQIKDILNRNNIITSNIRKNKETFVLMIHRQDHIEKFFKLIKPSNPHYIERYLNL